MEVPSITSAFKEQIGQTSAHTETGMADPTFWQESG